MGLDDSLGNIVDREGMLNIIRKAPEDADILIITETDETWSVNGSKGLSFSKAVGAAQRALWYFQEIDAQRPRNQ